MRLNEQIKNPVFNTGTTYIVEENVTFSSSVIIPENVTLIFQGGKFVVAEDCEEEITITGSNTRLEAPICTIFGKGIKVEGSWDIDRAYPQWFEIEKEVISTEHIKTDSEGNNIYENFCYDDWSTPINKAIKMKQIGEVFLKNGDYSIASPIIMNCRIQLVGESSQWGDSKKVLQKVFNEETNEVEDKEVYESIYGCTRFFPIGEGYSLYSDEYLLYVNAEAGTKSPIPGMQYIDQSTLIKNICFTDFISKSEDHKFTQKCIFAGGGVHLDRIVWYNFLQGIKYTETYNDTRSITNCSFKHDQINLYQTDDIDTTEDLRTTYAIDTGWLGDALKFEHNAIHSTCNGKALKLFNCGGGSIQGNIINSDVLIDGCKAIVFNANHCESGIQIEIINSSVTTNNNYIHRGNKPNFYIHSKGGYNNQSVVSLNNDMFIHLKTSNADYDICIDKETTLKVSNLFRYDITYTVFDKMYPCGINICKDIVIYENGNIKTYKPFDEFNNFSYITSGECYIQPGYNIQLKACIKNVNTFAIDNVQSNGAVSWHSESGLYKYYYQIVWDQNREIKKTLSSSDFNNSIFNIQWYLGGTTFQDVNTIRRDGNGVLIVLSENQSGNCAMVRLIREKIEDNSFQDVYIPVCGSRYLYDNGISICDYKWSTPFKFLSMETCDKNMEMFRIIDGNVECFTKREGGITPTTGWKRGDVIHNIGSNPSTIIVSDDINQQADIV